MGWDKHDLTITFETPLEHIGKVIVDEIKLKSKGNLYLSKRSNGKYTIDTNDTDISWYDFKEDMLLISKKIQNILFVLDGVIRYEDDETYRYYMLNGKMQDASPKLMYEEFDEKKLK